MLGLIVFCFFFEVMFGLIDVMECSGMNWYEIMFYCLDF